MDTVYLIPTEYQWECPICQKINYEIEELSKVICLDCKCEFEVI